MTLPTRKLGNSDLVVPLACLGTMTWGEQNTEEEAFAQMDYALERGAVFWDTAELYPVPPRQETSSRTETYIGRWLKSRNCREKIILATKVAGPTPGLDRAFIVANRSDPPQPNAPQPQLDAANIKAALEGSLRRLQTHYVDLYQIHWPARYVPKFGARQYKLEDEWENYPSIEEQVQAMGDLIKAGKVKHWGLSNETTFGVCQFVETAKRLGVPPPITIQNDFSLVARAFEEELAEACAPRHHNVALLAWGPLAGGTLTGKYLDGQQPAKARHTVFPAFQTRYHTERTMKAAAEYAALAHRKGLTPTALALAWCASRWYMGSVIVGATSVDQLKEDLDAFEGVKLDEDTLKEIDEIHVRLRNPIYSD